MVWTDPVRDDIAAVDPEKGQEFRTTRRCPHGFHHPSVPHSCDGCWCDGERDRRDYGWPHDTTPRPTP